ncbi:T9SS type A sorting domain-containing protein [Ekhidna sp.]|uniref:zinc-dependent metalloprotease n=1 Tax=Ekhidna sp. TaxID=2608089 RepID=UPI003299A5CA
MKTLIKNYLLTLIILLSAFLLKAQNEEKECGTILTGKDEILIRSNLIPLNRLRISNENQKLAIKAHIIRRSDGTGGLTEEQLITALAKVNDFYANAGLEFFLFGEIDYVDDDNFFDYEADQEDALASKRDLANAINIYFANSVTSGSSALCGYAYFPGNPDRILMDNSCTTNGTTLSHEIGHYLTLYHTHGKTNNGTTDELVDGSNCSTAGDDVCDTPADPNLTGKVNGQCQYTSNERDANGDLFQPNTENIMSYAPQNCRRIFTSGQYERALSGYLSFRNYLIQKPFISDFEVPQSIVCIGDEVTFTNLSEGDYESVEWEFSGGDPTSADSDNPVTSYSAAGFYDVTLTTYGEDGSTDTKTIQNAIKVESPNPEITALNEGFETSLISDYNIHTPGDSKSFSIEQTGFESSQSLSMGFYNYQSARTTDYLIFTPLENPGQMDYIVSFDYAFTYFSDGVSEQIDEVRILSKGCGDWTEVWMANGKENATADSKGSSFSPNNEEWTHVEQYLPFDPDTDFVQIVIEARNNNGNNFFIDNIKVEYADDIVIRNLQITNEKCAGDRSGEIVIGASFNGNEIQYSLDGQDYQSSGTFSELSAGEYTLSIKSGERVINEAVKVTTLSQLPASPVIIFSNDELRLLSSAFEIEWYYESELIDASGTTQIPFSGNGDYYVIVRNEAGCENISDVFTILGAEIPEDRLIIYPNPVKDVLNIENGNHGLLKITDLSGKVLKSLEITKTASTVNLSDLSEGIYVVTLVTSKKNLRTTISIRK